jgi:hypothetical protein
LVVHFLTAPLGETNAGALIGVGVQLFGFTFIVALWRARGPDGRFRYRPLGFPLSDKGTEKGKILLTWKDAPSSSRMVPLTL